MSLIPKFDFNSLPSARTEMPQEALSTPGGDDQIWRKKALSAQSERDAALSALDAQGRKHEDDVIQLKAKLVLVSFSLRRSVLNRIFTITTGR